MIRTAVALLFLLAGLMPGGRVAADPLPHVVSLDYCADQYVLALADRGQILGIATGPDDAWSALRKRARGLPRLRNAAEDVLALKPDLVVRSYGGDARARAFYQRLGLKVHNIGFADDFDAVARMVTETAAALGQPRKGRALVASMQADLAAVDRSRANPRVLYVTPAGVTTGSGTMMHAILEAAGFINIAAEAGRSGWHDLPLEQLVMAPPDLIVTGFFGMATDHLDNWSPTRHPALRDVLNEVPSVHLDGAQLSCPSWLMAEAALAAHKAVQEQQR